MEKNNENNNGNKEQPVVKEHIKPKYRKKLKKLLEIVIFSIVAGLIFGLVARFVFSSRLVGNLFGTEDESDENLSPTPVRGAVSFPSSTGSAQKQEDSEKGKDGEIKTVERVGQENSPRSTPSSTPTVKPSPTSNAASADNISDAPQETGTPAGKENLKVTGDVQPENPDKSFNGDDTQNDRTGTGSEDVRNNRTGEAAGLSDDGKGSDVSGTSGEGNGSGVTGSSGDAGIPASTGNVLPGMTGDGNGMNDGAGTDGEVTEPSGEDGNNPPEDSEGDGEQEPGRELFGVSSLSGYRQVMEELHEVACKTEKSLVRINAVTSIVNWMSETTESTQSTTGVIVADNGAELLVLTYYDKIKSADRLEIEFCSGNIYGGNILSFDAEYNMAVVAIPLDSLSEEDRSEMTAVVFGDTEEMYPGMPVIALGSPNGNIDSLEYGYVTGCGQKMYLMDGVCTLFTTDITNNAGSEGVIVNLDGELIGIISRQTAASSQTGTSTEISIESLTPVALKLCNSMRRPYFGVKTEDIPKSAMKDLELKNGIYVNEVAENSPAELAELHKGDIILSINGEKISSVRQFSEILMNDVDGEELVVKIYRSSRKSEPEITVSVKPEV